MKQYRLKIIKAILFVFSSLLFLTGCVDIGLLAFVLNLRHLHEESLIGELRAVFITLLIVIVFMTLLAVIVSIGAFFEKYWVLITTSCLLVLLTLAGAYCLIYIYLNHGQILGTTFDDLSEAANRYDELPAATYLFDQIHKKLSCCGPKSYLDWYEIRSSHLVPESCCRDPGSKACDQRKPNMTLTSPDFYTKNCQLSVNEYWLIYFVGFVSVIFFTDIGCIIMSCVFVCNRRRGYKGV